MYYLHHFFAPDFSHMNLVPQAASDGSIDYRYLGYVQNVVAGQVLAEITDLDNVPEGNRDPRFIYKEKRLPVGPNAAIHEKDPNKIVATASGYVFYHNGLISVKKLLNIRGNVGFHTGNIFFVGDLAVHGDVQTGFAVQAGNVLVKKHIESAKVQSTKDIVCLGGVKGAELTTNNDDFDTPAVLPNTLLSAERNIRLPFCEQVQIRAKGNVIIDGSCLHSTLYAGGNVIVRGRLLGGTIYTNGLVYVGKQLGSDYTTTTKINMGYNPFEYLLVQKLESRIKNLQGRADYFAKQAKRNAVMEQEFAPRLEIALHKLENLHAKRDALWKKFNLEERLAKNCRIVVPGTVMPGCEISIGTAFFRTDYTLDNVTFSLQNDEVVFSSPAMPVTNDMLNNPWKG